MKKNILLFAGLLLAVYLGVIFALSVLNHHGAPLISKLVEYSNRPGGAGYSLERFRQARAAGPVDAVFLGSAHAYRTFDTRVFQDAGVKAFNLGSVAQTPLNSYYLLEAYYPALKPRIVVVECYPLMLQSDDGFESFLDLVVNVPLDAFLWRMAFATRSPQAVHLIVSEFFQRLREPFAVRRQDETPGEAYVSGGYVEAAGKTWDPSEKFERDGIRISERQLGYLKKIASFCRARETRVVFVTQPLPEPFLKSLEGYDAELGRIARAARESGTPFVDTNDGADRLRMTPGDFTDAHNVDPSGAAKASRDLLKNFILPALEKRGS